MYYDYSDFETHKYEDFDEYDLKTDEELKLNFNKFKEFIPESDYKDMACSIIKKSDWSD